MELMNDLNNAEWETTLSEKEHAPYSDPDDPSIGVEETRTDPEQTELIPGTPLQRNLSANFNSNSRVIDQGENSLEEEKYPVTTVATSQQTSPDLRDNDQQVMVGVGPSINGTFATTGASANRNLGANGDDEHTTVNASPI